MNYNKALKDLETKLKVVKLYQEGKSCVEIGNLLGIAPRTLQNFIARDTHTEFWNWLDNENSLEAEEWDQSISGAKILFLDLEVSASVVAAFSMWKHFSTPDHVIEFPYILSFACNWLHEPVDKVYSKTLADYELFNSDHKNDRALVEELWQFIDEADIIVIQNSPFDAGWFNQRIALHDMPEPSPYRLVCTLKGLKKAMSLPSNSLGYSTRYFNLGVEKLHHEGISLWIRCMNGDVQALKDMETYNRGDIPTLRELYLKIRAYIPNHPNVAVYYNDGEAHCGVCGGTEMTKLTKNAYTNLSEYHSYRCNGCGTVRRDGRSLTLSKDRLRFNRTIVK